MQGVLYLYLFNRDLAEGKFAHIPELANFKKANGIRFVYYNKNKSVMKEFVVTTADEVFKAIVMKIQTVKQYTEQGILPPMTPDYCKTCAWSVKCSKNQKS
jgi:CRISPR/Cas system-associated exonuclease Cas4 (RecB family)